MNRVWTHLNSPQVWFGVLASVFGLLFVVLVPPFLVSDELQHVVRAYQISDSQIIPQKEPEGTGGTVPASFFLLNNYVVAHRTGINDIAHLSQFQLTRQEAVFTRFENTAINNPFMYTPQILAITIGKLANAPPVYLTYLSRLFNLGAYILLVVLAIRLIPFGKWALVAIGLLPTHVIVASSASGDVLSLGVVALFIACILWAKVQTGPLSKGQLAIALLLIAAVALSKPPYCALLLLCPLVPPRVLGGNRVRWLAFLGIGALVAIIVFGLWSAVVSATISPYGPADANITQQTHFVTTHPLSFLGAAVRTFVGDAGNGMFASMFVLVDTYKATQPLWVDFVYATFLGLIILTIRPSPMALKRTEKIYLASIGLVCLLSMSLLVYLSWTGVGKHIVEGIQPRYITPYFILLIPLAVQRTKPLINLNFKTFNWFRLATACFLFVALAVTLRHFYGVNLLF